MKNKVVVFGEMLWDCLPAGVVPGGAPMNVALNLHQLGLDSNLISAVGKDSDGKNLLDFLKTFELPLNLIQESLTHNTSKVLVDDSDKENIKYTIQFPVAWDFIHWNEELDLAVAESDIFIFGSLGVRHDESLDTLIRLLRHQVIRIFDANLRPPFYDFEVIHTLLQHADILKINDDELMIFANHFELAPNIESVCAYLGQHFPMELICITLGSKGAVIYQKGEMIIHSGYKVQVEDSIGAGDAFLSGFVKSYLEEKSMVETLDFACKLGAFVATKKGGTPHYSISDI
jgi:fructokinase